MKHTNIYKRILQTIAAFAIVMGFAACSKQEAPIEILLFSDKITIMGNGEEAVKFTVTANNEDVTEESEIFMSEENSPSQGWTILGSRNFSSKKSGHYRFHAKYGEYLSGDIKIEVLQASAPEPPDEIIPEPDPDPDPDPKPDPKPDPDPGIEGKTIVFVEGVSMDNGWYDVNKMGNGTLNGDINMCWAAASANMIQWWQDRYVAAGNELPAEAVTGKGKVHVEAAGRSYELALMELFHKEWDNSKGCNTAESIPWYFEGVNYGQTATPGSQAVPLTAGGYWKNIWSGIYPLLYHEYSYMFGWYKNLYTTEYTAYEHWGNGSTILPEERYAKFSEMVVEFIERGIASMAITLNANGGLNHATTIWGYEIDNKTKLITRLWITDSDDLTDEPKREILNEYQVSYNTSDKYITLASSSVRYGKCYVISLSPLSGYKKRVS